MKSLPSEIAELPCYAPTRFRRVAEGHPLWRHPFVERCRAARLTLAQVPVLGAQMYKFFHQFPNFLELALAACPPKDARIVIGESERTDEALSQARVAADCGVSGLFVKPPFGDAPAVLTHVDAVARALRLSIVLLDNPK